MSYSYQLHVRNNKDVNLRNLGLYLSVNWEQMDQKTKDLLMKNGYEEDNPIWYPDLERLNIAYDPAVWYGDQWLDEEERQDDLLGMIKPSSYYLVFASGCTWNGRFGYRLCGSVLETMERSYETMIYPRAVSVGGKTLCCSEYSHDVPMGHRTTIIALTDTEYDRLSNAEFEAVEAFVTRQLQKVKEN